MISIVIRNKNEAAALKNVLHILKTVYASDISEIILVDNNSTDNSITVAKKYNCKIVTIDDFTYGRAINYGMEAAVSKYVLLLSSHAIPVGNSFFKNAIAAMESMENAAGARFINSIENYNRAIKNDFKVGDPLTAGLMAACCIVDKSVWIEHKFNESLVAIEDKEWSDRVTKAGFQILDVNETYFYFIRRNKKSNLNRYKNETIAEYQLHDKKFPGTLMLIGYLVKKLFVTNTKNYFQTAGQDFLVFKTKFAIHKKLKNDQNK